MRTDAVEQHQRAAAALHTFDVASDELAINLSWRKAGNSANFRDRRRNRLNRGAAILLGAAVYIGHVHVIFLC